MSRGRRITPRVVAHRGASAELAEHTLAAYVRALEQGADGLECDVRMTRDGHLVCIHDRRIDRTSTGFGAVSAYDLAALDAHDFAQWHENLGQENLGQENLGHEIRGQEELGSVGLAGAGRPHTGVLTLAKLLDLVVDWPRPVQLFIETKHPARNSRLVEAALVTLLAKYGLATPVSQEIPPVVIMSFSPKALRRVRAEAPELPTVVLLSTLGRVRSGELPPWADIAGPRFGALRADPGFVLRAAVHGHPTYCWTVDEPAELTLCAEFGVTYVATNRPGDARELLSGS